MCIEKANLKKKLTTNLHHLSINIILTKKKRRKNYKSKLVFNYYYCTFIQFRKIIIIIDENFVVLFCLKAKEKKIIIKTNEQNKNHIENDLEFTEFHQIFFVGAFC